LCSPRLLQVLDALLKEICAALLETDVNVKLVASLRQKVKAKVKVSLEGGADKGKELNRKNIVQKVTFVLLKSLCGSGTQL
jgi:signal recognition particle subunit SRP54